MVRLMSEYRAVWSIDVVADSHEEAAAIAREIQLDTMSTATIFKVIDEKNNSKVIDCDNYNQG